MAVSKRTAQLYPSAGVLSGIFSPPDGKVATISTITACNQSADPTTFRVAISVDGSPEEAKQFLYYEEPLRGHRAFAATRGDVIPDGGTLLAQSANGLVSFNVSYKLEDAE